MPKFVRLIRVRYEHSQLAFYNRVKSTVSPTLVAKRAAQQTYCLLILLMVRYGAYFFLTQLINLDSGSMQNALRRKFVSCVTSGKTSVPAARGIRR
jgi:hypothetical protein